MSSRIFRILGLAIVAFAVGLLLSRSLFRPATPPETERATVLPQARALPEFSLLDQDGAALSRQSFAGHWTLVFFGFTRCPDVCPTTLATLAQVTRQLQDLPAADRPRVLMVTVDPERDTPAVLAPYLRFFGESFAGATGTAEAIAGVAGAFGVPYAKVARGSDYSMDHGSGIFIVGPGAGINAYLSAPHDAAIIARDFRRVLDFTG